MQKRSKRRFAVVMLLLILVAGSFEALPITDYAYVSETTGSRRGHRVWLGLWETSHWYKKSDLESFMREKYPRELQQRWASYARTGKNIWGTSRLFGHGPSVPIGLRLKELNSYLSTLSDADKRKFYEIFANTDRTVAWELAKNIEWSVRREFHLQLSVAVVEGAQECKMASDDDQRRFLKFVEALQAEDPGVVSAALQLSTPSIDIKDHLKLNEKLYLINRFYYEIPESEEHGWNVYEFHNRLQWTRPGWIMVHRPTAAEEFVEWRNHYAKRNLARFIKALEVDGRD